MSKLHFQCSNCKQEIVTTWGYGTGRDMYRLGYRVAEGKFFCPECVKTWKERNGEEFDTQIANSTKQFVCWWNREMERQLKKKIKISIYKLFESEEFLKGNSPKYKYPKRKYS